ncbi:hypothetical protein RMATCC62417_13532 [Rhizopus microsporus]|nr:hypothetical protein RMATCC62417_13532 [Rhizopus microsporus]
MSFIVIYVYMFRSKKFKRQGRLVVGETQIRGWIVLNLAEVESFNNRHSVNVENLSFQKPINIFRLVESEFGNFLQECQLSETDLSLDVLQNKYNQLVNEVIGNGHKSEQNLAALKLFYDNFT